MAQDLNSFKVSPMFPRELVNYNCNREISYADNFVFPDLGLDESRMMFPDLDQMQAHHRDPLSFKCECESLADDWFDWFAQ